MTDEGIRRAATTPGHRGLTAGTLRSRRSADMDGSAAVDYLGIVAVIAIMLVALVALRPHRAGPRSPVNPITPIVRLLGHPLENLQPKVSVRPRTRSTPATPARRRPRPRVDRSPVTVLLPEWWTRR